MSEGFTLWEVSKHVQHKGGFLPKIVYELLPDDSPVPLFSIGSISPHGMLVAAFALFSQTSQVWSLTERSAALGPSGIAGLDWKPRRGGNSALMTVDRDATVRLWIKVLLYAGDSSKSSHWIEEIHDVRLRKILNEWVHLSRIWLVAIIVPKMRQTLVLWALQKLF